METLPRKNAVACAQVDSNIDGPTKAKVRETMSIALEFSSTKSLVRQTRSKVLTMMKMLSTPTAKT